MINRKFEDSFNAIKPFLILLPIGYICISIYLFSADSFQQAASVFGIMSAVGFASLVLGLLFGFLFGIPKTVKSDNSLSKLELNKIETKTSENSIEFNTNLAEISDWLTKILVGVGLTQIKPIMTFFKTQVVDNLAPGFDLLYSQTTSDYKPSSIAISITIGDIIYSFVSGFIIGYLWTVLIYSETLKGNIQKIKEQLKVSTKIQLTRQIIDAIPSTDYLYPDFAYNEERNKTRERLDEIKRSIEQIFSRLKKDDNDIPSDSDSFLNEVISNINSSDYDFLRSIDCVKLGLLFFMQGFTQDNKNAVICYENAVKFFDKAISINKFLSIAYNLKGLTLENIGENSPEKRIKLGNFEQAIKLYNKAIEIDKRDSKAWRYKGSSFIKEILSSGSDITEKDKKDKARKALKALELSIRLDSNEVKSYINKALALDLLGKETEMLEAYNKAEEIDSKAPILYYNKACYYAIKNEYEIAMGNLATAISLNSDIKELIKKDPDFDSLRNNQNEQIKNRFEKMLQ